MTRRIEIEVIVPAMRQGNIQEMLYSFSKNTVKPDRITIVSNEISKKPITHGLSIRLIRFASLYYPIGHLDTALRRDIGVWNSESTHIITFDDDQLASVNLIESSIELFRQRRYFWGNYRYLDFSQHSIDEIIHMASTKGRTREVPPNDWHLWQSSYGGMFGAEKALVEQLGGFDLIFCGWKHGGCDQKLGKLLANSFEQTDKVFVYEPPFAWHPESRIEWSPPNYSNLCSSEHQMVKSAINGINIHQCSACPYFRPLEGELFTGETIMRFDSAKVEIEIENFD